jgi:hypothetical protein
MAASRIMLIARIFLIPLILLMQLAYGLWRILLFIWHGLLFIIRHERDIKTWESARQACQFCANNLAFLLLLSDKWPSGAVRVKLSYSPIVSYVEFIIRPFFAFLLFFNSAALAILLLPLWALQFLHIFVFGRRHPGLHRIFLSYLGFRIESLAYAFLGVEERPSLFPSFILSLFSSISPNSKTRSFKQK